MAKKQQKSGKTILVVEDDRPVLDALDEKFTREGFRILRARNGAEGIDALCAEQPDLILLDIVMPVMDGITMLRRLKENDRNKDIPVLVLTNLSDADKLKECLENGAFDCLVKSDWKLEDVVGKVKERLGQ
jgi:CheY-like chemotaxis protein